MPKRTDLESILIIGAGPIVIGQACEFDYSGAQACKALRQEGYRIILVNSNPATIMTDPDMAEVTYIEPIHWRSLAKIIENEKPCALLPTMGGQTALNAALQLEKKGILKKFNVQMIGANAEAIDKAENRQRFNNAMKEIGLKTPRYGIAHSLNEAQRIAEKIGFPCIIRPSFTMGGSGGGIAYNHEEFEKICRRGFDLSPTHSLLIDESLIGWKEYEMEVVRDKNDNAIIICSIENVDAMGIHTGDSITVAPAQTLNDKEYQKMRTASLAILNKIGVETGGANVQFALDPNTGEMIVIEMNPRVSRSSALASKATGFPIAKIAAKLAIGYSLDELTNDITGGYIPASFEPVIDYVVVKIPRFNFEKFNGCNDRLTTQMKSVGEVMAIGRTFQESLQKALRSLEIGATGLDTRLLNYTEADQLNKLRYELKEAGDSRIWYVADAFRAGFTVEQINELTHIDNWFLAQIEELIQLEEILHHLTLDKIDVDLLRTLKRKGFSDARLAKLMRVNESDVRQKRKQFNLHPVYKRVDTCAAEFSSATAYLYSTYEDECEAEPQFKKTKIMILGGGPNRIGQGIEFDYCCVHASMALKSDGYETIMVNCNPETVSTDYDISDKLYFEPVTLESVLDIAQVEKPDGVVVQFGGQTPLKLAKVLEENGIPIIGTSADNIDRAENRERFQQVIKKLKLIQPENRTVTHFVEATHAATLIGYPLVIRPSYVLGGRAMEIVYNENELKHYFDTTITESNAGPLLLEQFLDEAIEVDIDIICDGQDILIGGIMEHIEQAGVHSGDSACSLPAYSLNESIQSKLREQVKQIALEIGVKGLMNAQFAIQNGIIYVIEVNPRAARTIPFVSKATGRPLAKIAARVMCNQSLAQQKAINEVIPSYYSIKEAILPFNKFLGVDPILGPEMRSTGEVMGIGRTFAEAFAKANCSMQPPLKKQGNVLLSVKDADKSRLPLLASKLIDQGFVIEATSSTANALKAAGIDCNQVNIPNESDLCQNDFMKNGAYCYILTTAAGREETEASKALRCNAIQNSIAYNTTMNGALATIAALDHDPTEINQSLQSHYENET